MGDFPLCKKASIHQLTTMLATPKKVLFPGHNHLLTTGTDDRTLWLLPKCHQVLSVPVVSRQLWPRNRTFLAVASMVVTWWIVAFLHSVLPPLHKQESTMQKWKQPHHATLWSLYYLSQLAHKDRHKNMFSHVGHISILFLYCRHAFIVVWICIFFLFGCCFPLHL